MIATIRAKNIYAYISTLEAITDLCAVYAMRPDEKASPIGSYCYITRVTDLPTTNSNVGMIYKKARISFHIVTKQELEADETPESVLMDIIDQITNSIVNIGHQKVYDMDGIKIVCIAEDTVSPIFNENNRHYIVKDYLFDYACNYD